MTTKLSQTEVKKLLVSERKSMREKQKQSLFMRRTLSIYNGMKKRAAELERVVPFGLEEFRMWCLNRLAIGVCRYCYGKLTAKTIVPDHCTPISRDGGFEIGNLAPACASCNFQKGILTSGEFINLLNALRHQMSPEAAADVKRRLTIGGRWSWK